MSVKRSPDGGAILSQSGLRARLIVEQQGPSGEKPGVPAGDHTW
jgi:hypothetical protein